MAPMAEHPGNYLNSLSSRRPRQMCQTFVPHWSFIPEHTSHFGILWESAVKGFKIHLRRMVRNARLSFGEMCTSYTCSNGSLS